MGGAPSFLDCIRARVGAPNLVQDCKDNESELDLSGMPEMAIVDGDKWAWAVAADKGNVPKSADRVVFWERRAQASVAVVELKTAYMRVADVVGKVQNSLDDSRRLVSDCGRTLSARDAFPILVHVSAYPARIRALAARTVVIDGHQRPIIVAMSSARLADLVR